MKSYTHTNGDPIANETLDRIADDVRKFDQERSAEARNARALDKAAVALIRVRDELIKANELQAVANSQAERAAVALEVQASLSLGVPAHVVVELIRTGRGRGRGGLSSLLTAAVLDYFAAGDSS